MFKSLRQLTSALILTAAAIASCAASERYVVVTDFGGVVATLSRRPIIMRILARLPSRLGVSEIPSAISAFARLKETEDLVYRTFDKMGKCGSVKALDHHGNPFPGGLYELQTGTVTCAEILRRIPAAIAELDAEGAFRSRAQAVLTAICVEEAFRPEGLADGYTPSPQFMKLLDHCAETEDCAGNPTITTYLLSNFNDEQFDEVRTQQKFERLFKCIPRKQQFISGECHSDEGLKPNPRLFDRVIRHVCKTHNVSADHVIFLDDQLENCIGMQEALWRHGCSHEKACSNVFWICRGEASLQDVRRELTGRGVIRSQDRPMHEAA